MRRGKSTGEVRRQSCKKKTFWVAHLLIAVSGFAFGAPKVAYLNFDGSNDHVLVPDSASLDLKNAITVEAWIRPESISSTKQQNRVVSKGIEWELTISTGDTGTRYGTSGDVQWRAVIGGVDRRIGGGRLTPGTWHHIAGTYDGHTFALYVDGELVAQASRSGAIAANNLPLCIGDHPTLSRCFDGDIDEVRIWNYARSGEQIRQAMETELTGTEAGLVAYFKLNEAQGQSAADSGPYGNNGVLGDSQTTDSADPRWVYEGPENKAPQVSAGPDLTLTLPQNQATLRGSASDDGLPDGTLVLTWTLAEGPAGVQFEDPHSAITLCTFPQAGTYVLLLQAYDGELTSQDSAVVTVTAQALPPVVNLWCRFDLPAESTYLAWSIPSGVSYESLQVRRNGTLVAQLSGISRSYIDNLPPAGTVVYTVKGISGSAVSEDASCSIAVPQPKPIAALTASPLPEEGVIELTWTNGEPYDMVEIYWGNTAVAALPGQVISYRVTCAPFGYHRFAVQGVRGGRRTDPAETLYEGGHIDWDPPGNGAEPLGYHLYLWREGEEPPPLSSPTYTVYRRLTVPLKELLEAGALPQSSQATLIHLQAASFNGSGISAPAGPISFLWQVVR